MSYASRVEAARALMAEKRLDALLIGQPANRRYLSGFAASDESSNASAGWIVLTPDDGFLVTVFNYYEAVVAHVRHLEPVRAKPRLLPALSEFLNRLPLGHIGFE